MLNFWHISIKILPLMANTQMYFCHLLVVQEGRDHLWHQFDMGCNNPKIKKVRSLKKYKSLIKETVNSLCA